MNIKEITTSDELEALFDKSATDPVLFFKHSVTCPISLDVYSSIEGVTGEINLIVVQRSRPISMEIAERTGVRHESPQALVIHGGKVVYHASHYDITAEALNAKLS